MRMYLPSSLPSYGLMSTSRLEHVPSRHCSHLPIQLDTRPLQAVLSKSALSHQFLLNLFLFLPPPSPCHFASSPSCSLSKSLFRTQQLDSSLCCTHSLSFWQILLFGRDHLASLFFLVPLFLGFNLPWSCSIVDRLGTYPTTALDR